MFCHSHIYRHVRRYVRKVCTHLILLGFVSGVCWCSFLSVAFAGDTVTIFDVRKSLPLDPSEPVYHDFYINAGPEAGLKKGMYVSVVRKNPVHDPVQNKAQATLSVEVARVQLIHVDRNISVGRLVEEFDAEDRPLLEFEGIMIGDTLDLSTVSMEPPKERRHRKGPPGSQAGPSEPGERLPAVNSLPTTVELTSPPVSPPGMLRPANGAPKFI